MEITLVKKEAQHKNRIHHTVFGGYIIELLQYVRDLNQLKILFL